MKFSKKVLFGLTFLGMASASLSADLSLGNTTQPTTPQEVAEKKLDLRKAVSSHLGKDVKVAVPAKKAQTKKEEAKKDAAKKEAQSKNNRQRH